MRSSPRPLKSATLFGLPLPEEMAQRAHMNPMLKTYVISMYLIMKALALRRSILFLRRLIPILSLRMKAGAFTVIPVP